MKYVTRLNPTVNGELHIGHAYTALINQTEARRTGGKFICRWDDTQKAWNKILPPAQVDSFRDGMKRDLEWLGIVADVYESQVDMATEAAEVLQYHRYIPVPEETESIVTGTTLAGCNHHFYPYTDYLTSEKVIFDWMDGVNWLIRGMDLITEDCLYRHFCVRFELPTPRLDYIPRLYCGNDAISKTAGKFKICEFRQAGYDPQELLDRLAVDCLTQPGWYFENIKTQPMLGAWADEALHGIYQR